MNTDTPTAVYFKNTSGKFACENVVTVTKPASPWTPRKVVTEGGKRFSVSDASIVLVY